jgi:hypothetical protein
MSVGLCLVLSSVVCGCVFLLRNPPNKLLLPRLVLRERAQQAHEARLVRCVRLHLRLVVHFHQVDAEVGAGAALAGLEQESRARS